MSRNSFQSVCHFRSCHGAERLWRKCWLPQRETSELSESIAAVYEVQTSKSVSRAFPLTVSSRLRNSKLDIRILLLHKKKCAAGKGCNCRDFAKKECQIFQTQHIIRMNTNDEKDCIAPRLHVTRRTWTCPTCPTCPFGAPRFSAWSAWHPVGGCSGLCQRHR